MREPGVGICTKTSLSTESSRRARRRFARSGTEPLAAAVCQQLLRKGFPAVAPTGVVRSRRHRACVWRRPGWPYGLLRYRANNLFARLSSIPKYGQLFRNALYLAVNSGTTLAQVVIMMPRHVPDTPVVLGFIGSCSYNNCSHLRSQIIRCEQRVVNMCVNTTYTTIPEPSHYPHISPTQPHMHGKAAGGLHRHGLDHSPLFTLWPWPS